MTIDYDRILNQLNKKYTVISKKKKNYFINNKEEVVATYDDHSISMFFEFPENSEEIWNHEGMVVATFAKDFQVNDKIADIIILEGLVGTCNDTEIIDNYAYLQCNNNELKNLFDTKTKIAPCGQIYSSNGIASIKISDEMVIDNIKVNKKDDGFDLNVININGINPNFDYKKAYDFWRQKNDRKYTIGFNRRGSYETREWTERRKKSTVDKDSIFYIGNPYSHILDPIYYDSKSSLNARRLQMKYVLSQITSNPDEILKGYDFNIREVDVQTKKR